MRKIICIPAILFFVACGNTPETKPEAKSNDAHAEPANTKIKNGVFLKQNGLKASQAFLLFDDGTRVPEDNTVQVNQRVSLRIVLDGWTEDNGKVFPGASETITTNEGDTLVYEPDLFEAYTQNGAEKKDAEYLTLFAVITQLDKLYDYFNVTFRVWDKKSNADVSGSYKLYIK